MSFLFGITYAARSTPRWRRSSVKKPVHSVPPIDMNPGDPELSFTVATLKPGATLKVELEPLDATITFTYSQPLGLTGGTIYLRADEDRPNNGVQMLLNEQPIELDVLVHRLLAPVFAAV
jgi:hypothetical protein